jgi:hypothetical protein
MLYGDDVKRDFLFHYETLRKAKPALKACGISGGVGWRNLQKWKLDPTFVIEFDKVDGRIKATRKCRCSHVGPTEDFVQYTTLSGTCKKCHSRRVNSNRRNTFTGRLTKLLHDARVRDQSAKSITVSFLRDILHKQKGLCYYTGIQMSFSPDDGVKKLCEKKFASAMSIDRLDSTRGYESSNIVLCCLSLNMMKGGLSYPTFIDACEQVIRVDKSRSLI